MNLYWTGARSSDTKYTGRLFKGSFTIYGNNRDGNLAYCATNELRIDHNVESKEASAFIQENQLRLIEEDPDCRFMAYNPNCVFGAPDSILKRTLCLNDAAVMNLIDNKISFRNLVSPLVPMIECRIRTGSEIASDYDFIRAFEHANLQYVIQAPISTGGAGTFLVNKSNIKQVIHSLSSSTNYIVTQYIENNIPINVHCIVYDDYSLVLTPSVQIIVNEDDRLLYRGADYIAYQSVPELVKEKVILYMKVVSEKIRLLGYRGVIGFDGIISNDQIFIVEANNRFQGSTFALNFALWQSGLPSVQQLNLEAFGYLNRTDCRKFDKATSVPYSYFVFLSDLSGKQARLISERAHHIPEVVDISDDGYSKKQEAADNAYAFHLLFNQNICEINPYQSSIRVHPALVSPTQQWYNDIFLNHDLTKIKISLINQGVFISNEARKFLAWNKQLFPGTYYNIDLQLSSEQYANCPVCIKFAKLSPFTLECSEIGDLYLSYYGDYLISVDYTAKPQLPQKFISSGIETCEIAFFSTDRLRLQNSAKCVFNAAHSPCKFCEVCNWDLNFSEKDILETIDHCFSLQPSVFRHILIGGRSHPIGKERETIIKMCHRIKKHCADMPIYLMCLPPRNQADIKAFYDSGITEFGFNIEVYDRSLAQKIMPGKGGIPLNQYLGALEYATDLCGKNGSVRTAFIVGVEPVESLMEGIEAVCKIGVAPILSAFRPIPDTPMENAVPLSSAELHSITLQAEAIASQYGLSLGPNCIACQNNTLKVVIEKTRRAE